MVALCVTPIKGTVVRLVTLDICGNPVTGASSSVVVTDGFIEISPKPVYEEGTEHTKRQASGALCVNQKDPNQLKRVEHETKFCVMDPDALVIITGERLLTASSVTGSGVAFGEGELTSHYSMEVWQKVTGRNACDASGLQRYVYWAFFNNHNAMVSDFKIENAPMEFTVKAETEAAGTLWGNGPGSAGPWFESTAQTGEHFLYNVTTTAPPTASCGATTLT